MVWIEKFGAATIVFLILLANAITASTGSITLIKPVDRSQILDNTTNKVEFVFHLTNTYRVDNCTLFVKDNPRKTENKIFQNNNNTMFLYLEDSYDYYWHVECFDSQNNKLQSNINFFLKGAAPSIIQEEPEPLINDSAALDYNQPLTTETPKKMNKIELAWSKIPFLGVFSIYEFLLGLALLGGLKYYFLK